MIAIYIKSFLSGKYFEFFLQYTHLMMCWYNDKIWWRRKERERKKKEWVKGSLVALLQCLNICVTFFTSKRIVFAIFGLNRTFALTFFPILLIKYTTKFAKDIHNEELVWIYEGVCTTPKTPFSKIKWKYCLIGFLMTVNLFTYDVGIQDLSKASLQLLWSRRQGTCLVFLRKSREFITLRVG